MPLSEFKYQGITEFTLFDSDLMPVSERLVYLNSNQNLNISLQQVRNRYGKRNQVIMNIKITDDKGDPVKASMAISVVNKLSKDVENTNNILSHNHLTSQIRGRIHNPASYFDKSNKDRLDDMDLLLLTQGWCKYDWNLNEALKDEVPFILESIPGEITMTDRRRTKAQNSDEQSFYSDILGISESMHVLNIAGSENNKDIIHTDSSGHYFEITAPMINQHRGEYIYIKPMLGRSSRAKVSVEESFSVIDSLRKGLSLYESFNSVTRQDSMKYSQAVLCDLYPIFLNKILVMNSEQRRLLNRDAFMLNLDSIEQAVQQKAWVCDCHLKSGGLPIINDYELGVTHHPEDPDDPFYFGERITPIFGMKYRVGDSEGKIVTHARTFS